VPLAFRMASQITPAGRHVELFNECVFADVRARASIDGGFVNEGWTFDDFKSGGGKGGTLMAFVGSYIVKQLSRADHSVLLEITESFTEHIRGPTLLCPIYLHFRDSATGTICMVIGNVVGTGKNIGLYDLKGCSDDKMLEKDGEKIVAVRKRIWNIRMRLGKSPAARQRYREGKTAAFNKKFEMNSNQRQHMMECLKRDVGWLSSHNLMDYSLLVAVRDQEGRGSICTPFVSRENGMYVATYMGIIDFLQGWTKRKRVAQCIKCLEKNRSTVPPQKYADRFLDEFTRRFVVSRDLERPSQESGAMPSAALDTTETSRFLSLRTVGAQEVPGTTPLLG